MFKGVKQVLSGKYPQMKQFKPVVDNGITPTKKKNETN